MWQYPQTEMLCKRKRKKLKYKSLDIEIQRMWNLKCTIVPVIIGATGVVTRRLRKNLEAVPGKHSIDSLQKTAILGTSHVIRKVLQCEAWSLRGEDHRSVRRSTGKKIPVTRDDNNDNNSYICLSKERQCFVNRAHYFISSNSMLFSKGQWTFTVTNC